MQRETGRQVPQKKNGPHTDPLNSLLFSGDFIIRMSTSILPNSLGLLGPPWDLENSITHPVSGQLWTAGCNLLMLRLAKLPYVSEQPTTVDLAA